MPQKNFNNQKKNLTDQDVDQIVAIVGYRCRLKTVKRLRSILTYGVHIIPEYGIFERLTKDGVTWSYCAGQSYPDEIRTLRESILKG